MIERTQHANAITDERLARMPAEPGVYLMKDAKGQVIYAGKAANLRSRVRSYFRGGDGRPTVPFLVARARDIDCIVTPTETDALILENTLIKKHKPRYNLRLLSDITYLSLRIDPRGEFARFDIVRKRKKDGAVYLGPYASAKAARQTLQFVHRVFPLRQCADVVMRNRTRPCILYDIGRCCGPCCLPVSKEEYARHVQGAIQLLSGRNEEITEILARRMQEHSDRMEFEKAAVLRDKIAAINATVQRQRVAFAPSFECDALAHHAEQGRLCFVLLCYRNGLLIDSRTFTDRDNGLPLEEIYNAFISQYYGETDGGEAGRRETSGGDKAIGEESGALGGGMGGGMAQPIPPLLLVDVEPSDAAMLAACLKEMRQGPCEVRRPQRGEMLRVVEIARANAREHLRRSVSREGMAREALEDLQRKLHLAILPSRIECYDVSTLQGQATVASRVMFVDSEPSKDGYRRYTIKTVEGTDDFAAMREVLTRRFRRVAEGEDEAPDLVIIDGGIGQLNVATAVFADMGVGLIAVVGLAKSHLKTAPGEGPRRQRLREEGAVEEGAGHIRTAERVFLPGRKNPVLLQRNHPALYLIQRIRDEAHRFAITFHKQLRGRATIASALDAIPGVGPTRRRALLRHFGSLTKIKEATVEELAAAPGVSGALAAAIHRHLHGKA